MEPQREAELPFAPPPPPPAPKPERAVPPPIAAASQSGPSAGPPIPESLSQIRTSRGPESDPFAHEPLFKPRRNPARRWTMAAIGAAVLLGGGIVAVQLLGTPTFASDIAARLGIPVGDFEVPLLLEVPRKPERRTLESGNELFAVTGRVINPTSQSQRVPDILAELRDAQGRVVYGWTITPPKRTLPPKGSIEFNSAEVDVPKGARALNLSFSGVKE